MLSNSFKWKHYEGEIILLNVRWYLKYPLSYRKDVYKRQGHSSLKGKKVNEKDIELTVETYKVCEGTEYFIAFEDLATDILIGFLRLRFPSIPHRPELQEAALIRELHVYGSMVPIGREAKQSDWQHKGYGKELLGHAEKIVHEAGYRKLVVVSGIGAREYLSLIHIFIPYVCSVDNIIPA